MAGMNFSNTYYTLCALATARHSTENRTALVHNYGNDEKRYRQSP